MITWRTISWRTITPPLLLAGAILWALWPILSTMAERWSSDPRYAHGYLVPVFSLALLWMRWPEEGAPGRDRWRSSSWGLAAIALGAAAQLVGGFYRINSIEGFALLPYAVGAVLILGGMPTLRWAWPSIAFLIFMIPLPWRIEKAMGPPLQHVATLASTYTLQTIGVMAFAEGNVIQLNEGRIGVVEACSGLSMLITFIALSTGMALVVKRPLLDKIVLILSAIPVALIANIARISLTGMLHETVGGHVADKFYHDLAGWVMIPFALVLYWFEILVFSRILIEEEKDRTVLVMPSGVGRPARGLASAAAPAPGHLPRAMRRGGRA